MMMKSVKTFAIVVCASIFAFYGCKDDTQKTKQAPKEPMKIIDTRTLPNPNNPNQAVANAPQNAAGVWHYTCTKGCDGGSGTAAKCSTCGNLLVHNTLYHNSATNPATTPPAAATPSQNTAGVWHYTCGKGCSGGSGSAGTCSTCGSTLNHNTAFHQ